MKIATRLWLLSAVMINLLVISGAFSWWATSNMAAKSQQIIELGEIRSQLNQLMRISVANREQYMLALQHNPEYTRLAALHDHPLSQHTDTLPKNAQTVQTIIQQLDTYGLLKSEFEQPFQQFLQARQGYAKQAIHPGYEYLHKGEFQRASEHLLKVINPQYTQLEKDFQKVTGALIEKGKQLNHDNEQLEALVEQVQLWVVLGSILIGLLMSWLTVANLKKTIQSLNQSLANASNSMVFNQQLPPRSDEFSGLVDSINHLFFGLNNGLNEVKEVISGIAKGQVNQRIKGNYTGDIERLQQDVNQSIEHLQSVMGDLSSAMSSLSQGQFSVTINTEQPGIYGEMLNQVSQSFITLDQVIREINQAMYSMREADFNARITIDAQGELNALKNAINESMAITAQVIQSIAHVVEAQASGDLTVALAQGVYKGQFHDLKNAMAYASQRVRESIRLGIGAAEVVNLAAGQVSAGADDLSSRVQEQAAALEETTQTMNHILGGLHNNKGSVHSVAKQIASVNVLATHGQTVMTQTTQAMQNIQNSSQQISDIVSLIDSIAFQTNLLALNAAVEAARAGEHGRGFAVVAAEVRNLSQNSANAAMQIKELVLTSASQVAEGGQLVAQTATILTNIEQAIVNVVEQVNHLTLSTDEQLRSIEQVNAAVNAIDRVTQENAALVEETSAVAQNLNQEASALKENMSFFRT